MTDHLTSAELGGARLGERATLLQISSAFCAPCRAARVVLGRTAQEVDGVRHVELDVAGHEDLAERLRVRSTPVVVLLDGDGSVRSGTVSARRPPPRGTRRARPLPPTR